MTSADSATQNYGAVFTRRWVVEVLLDLTGYTVDRDLGGIHLLEPACGSGAFLGPAVERLIASARSHGAIPGSRKFGGFEQAESLAYGLQLPYLAVDVVREASQLFLLTIRTAEANEVISPKADQTSSL